MNKINQGILVYNDLDFLKTSLNLHNVVDKIIIVEGAIKGYPNYYFTDDKNHNFIDEDVHNYIEEYKNKYPEKVIHIIANKPLESKNSQKQILIDNVDCDDWLLINDSDEVYNPEDITRIRIYIEKYPEITEFVPIFIHFGNYFNIIRKPNQEIGFNVHHQRMIKVGKQMHFSCHYPTACEDYVNHRDTVIDKKFANKRAVVADWYVYHYTYCRNLLYTFMKDIYYEMRRYKDYDIKIGIKKAIEEFNYRETIDDKYLLFTGEHPESIKNSGLIKNLNDGGRLEDWKNYAAYNINGYDKLKSIVQNPIPLPKLIYNGEMW